MAHLLRERLIGSVGPGLLAEFLPLAAMLHASVAKKKNPKTKTSRSSKIQSVGDDLTEEKRHAAGLCYISGFYLLLLSFRREPGYAIPMP